MPGIGACRSNAAPWWQSSARCRHAGGGGGGGPPLLSGLGAVTDLRIGVIGHGSNARLLGGCAGGRPAAAVARGGAPRAGHRCCAILAMQCTSYAAPIALRRRTR